MGNNTTDSVDIWNNPAVYGTRVLFYALSPRESSFSKLEEVPNYVSIVTPIFFVFVLTEVTINSIRGVDRKKMRWNDAMSSIAQGFISQLPKMAFRNIELTAYLYVYKNYCVYELPWDASSTWIIAMLGVDLGYYWVHRCAHEVNFMWAAHQVHHSSEDYNLSTALRQSVLQPFSSWIFYLPMAFFVPPQVFLVHVQLNLLYQFWIHTEVVHKLGPLEWILNTPSHHRVHHGRNRYCIDKNYAGVLIIWDRMFGTFVEEDDNDVIAYGLVHPLNSWDSIYTQLCHWKYMIGCASKAPSLSHKLSIFFKGPGWVPGKGRLGDITDIPDVHGPLPKYNKSVSHLLTIYTWTHFLMAIVARTVFDDYKKEIHVSPHVSILLMLYFLWTITNIGYIYEQKWYAPYLELLRCVFTLVADTYICGQMTCASQAVTITRYIFILSTTLWTIQSAKQFGDAGEKELKKE